MKRKIAYKIVIISLLIIISGYLALGYLSAYFGWYANEPWKYRVGTIDIKESKKRGVFVKEVHFEIDSFPRKIENFRAYIEKGFRYGHSSVKETIPLVNSNYPYQLSFSFQPSSKLGILINEGELKKFDSSNENKGYLKLPKLNDTVVFYLAGENVHSGIVKVWN